MLPNSLEIKEIAIKIREILNITNNDFDITKIVKNLGGKITIGNEECIIKRNEENFEIILIKYSSFSIAKKLGTLFLHMKYLINPKEWSNIPNNMPYEKYSPLPYSTLENEANEFANNFLSTKNHFLSTKIHDC